MSSTPASYPPPPAGLNYLAVIRPSLKLLLLTSAWSSVLIPLLFTLFLFSSKSLRRTPIFMLNVASIIMGLALGVLSYYNGLTTMLSPELTIAGTTVIAYTIFINALPLFSESILVLRVLTVYPLRRTSRSTLMIVYIPLCCMKVARLVNILVYWVTWFPTILAGGNPIAVAQQSWQLPSEKIEWFLQMLDNAYASAIFLYRLRQSRHVGCRVEQPTSYSKRISTLFWIAVSNFVFPVMLSFVQFVLAFKAQLFLDATYIIITNVYFEIIAVLLATVWSAGSKWSEKQQATRDLAAVTLPPFTAGLMSTRTPALYQGDSTAATCPRSAILMESVSLGNDIESNGCGHAEVKHDTEC
ncbi:uncharacterized protein EV420DRAFT_903006 [Desarmillaria tabescens]|uniref:Uncharacterized protein n=1 Tax=Armillaria tabescens TaxID=1929756 RepID=A0AA39MU96_ARMTA|nr:uncharacterized protein EV420DRAFT_903006 [Desarmillaria tabescens]KAK0446448.1 hypothetical protein EV420DRAFT_903006 [Desarmillaria tabescens]